MTNRLPTHIEIAGVSTFLGSGIGITGQVLTKDDRAQVESLLDQTLCLDADSTDQDTWSRKYANPGLEVTSEVDPEITRRGLILTRKERRRLAGLPEEDQNFCATGESDEESDETDFRSPHKRPRLHLYDGLVPIDDSGIAFDRTADFLADEPLERCPGVTASSLYDEANFFGAEKENVPPLIGSESQCSDVYRYSGNTTGFLDDAPGHFDAAFSDMGSSYNQGLEYDDRGGFVPLSFGSQHTFLSQLRPKEILSQQAPDAHLDRDSQRTGDEPPDSPMPSYDMPKPTASHLLNLDFATHLGIADFARLRAKKISSPVPGKSIPTIVKSISTQPLPQIAREEIHDCNTLRLPSPWSPPTILHRYMASLETIQMRGLIQALRSRQCAVDLVERDSLSGVAFILDPHTAVIFSNLFLLPSQGVNLTCNISEQSWRYSRLLVVLEAYPTSRAVKVKSDHDATTLCAYTPPILKAIKKLRRDIEIANGCGTKRTACDVRLAFADTVEEAAIFTRYFGDLAETDDKTHGAIWGDRAWLDDDAPEVF